MHVTLRFLGEKPERDLDAITDLMRRAAAAVAPFEIIFNEMGAFDSMEDPRVVWIGLQNCEPIGHLADLLQREETRPYIPHMTLGRRRGGASSGEFVSALKGLPALGVRQSVRAISLYASRPAPFGHAYEVLFDVSLTGAS